MLRYTENYNSLIKSLPLFCGVFGLNLSDKTNTQEGATIMVRINIHK